MNVVLINPPDLYEIRFTVPRYVQKERGVTPPLGILYIASYLAKHSDHNVSVIDCHVEGMSYKELRKKVIALAPDVVGITTLSMSLLDVIETIKLVKEINPETKVVLGGPHCAVYPRKSLDLEGVDFVGCGEGEILFTELLNNLHDEKKLRRISGLYFRDSMGNVIDNGKREFIKNLDDLPHPARYMVPYKKYSSILLPGIPVTNIFTSRGCPFRCTFCDRPNMGKSYRARSAQNMVEEIAECVEMGINDFLFYDDTFTVIRKRVYEFCDLIIKRNLKINFDIRAHVNTMDSLMLEKLKLAGCKAIHYGVESGSPAVLKSLKKGLTLPKVAKVFEMTRKAKIRILAYFMIGLPGELLEDVQESFRVMRQLKPDYVNIGIFTPFPATESYLEAVTSGLMNDVWMEFSKNPTKDFEMPIWPGIFSRDALIRLMDKGFKEFYTQPAVILKQLGMVGNLKDIHKKGRAFMSMLTGGIK